MCSKVLLRACAINKQSIHAKQFKRTYKQRKEGDSLKLSNNENWAYVYDKFKIILLTCREFLNLEINLTNKQILIYQ